MNYSLTTIGLIATILAVLFGFAAFITSHRKHHDETSSSAPETDETPDSPFREDQDIQYDSTRAGAGAREGHRKSALAVFKQVDAKGLDIAHAADYSDDEYVWE